MTTNQDSPNTAGAAEAVAWMYEYGRSMIIKENRDPGMHKYKEIPLYAHPPENPPKRPSVVPDDIEVLLSAVEKGELTNVDRHLNARMCCDGHMCGCRGSTVGEYLAYELRTALTAAIPAIRAQAVAEIVAWLRMGEHVHSRSGSIESERVFKLIADALERRDHETTA